LCEPGLCYDWAAYKVNYKNVDDLLIYARSKYSQFLVGILKDMVIEDENVRPCFGDLNALLIPF
jgi:hypothetical protein